MVQNTFKSDFLSDKKRFSSDKKRFLSDKKRPPRERITQERAVHNKGLTTSLQCHQSKVTRKQQQSKVGSECAKRARLDLEGRLLRDLTLEVPRRIEKDLVLPRKI